MKQQQFWMDSAVVGLSFVSLDPVASFARFATDNPVFSNTPKPFALCRTARGSTPYTSAQYSVSLKLDDLLFQYQ